MKYIRVSIFKQYDAGVGIAFIMPVEVFNETACRILVESYYKISFL
jgi:hypothetical protein